MTKPLAGPQTLLRTLNARAILEALARRGPLTRAELMGETGLSRTAVTQVLRMLEAGGAVASAGVDRATRGPAATRVSLHPGLGFAAAVHVDHTAMHVTLVDPTGAVRAQHDAPLGRVEDRAADIAALIAECRETVQGPLRHVVVAMPGIVTPDGEIRDDQGPDGGALRATLTTQVECPVHIENDVNLAALAESESGVGRELSSFTLLLIDQGLGAGTVLGGVLHRGAAGIAGEVVYLPQPPLPIGAPVINEDVVADLALLHGRDPADPLLVHLDACGRGDDAAQAMIDELARRLVTVAGTVTLVIDPEAFVLAGHAAHPCFVAAVHRAAANVSHLLVLRFLTSAFGHEATMVGAIGQAASALRERSFSRFVAPGGMGTA
ncbi:ROK family transcriptional regulator [Microbacterium sp. TWP3-1-2b2]|uniref:ROK family transcriptional regulator n=1 Tax=Microbacterium sp. TWP3-1-2b2 TaxID=2804651 RepID=UPI003CECDCC9